MRNATNTTNGNWYHFGCVEGGSGTLLKAATKTFSERSDQSSVCPGRETSEAAEGPGSDAQHPLSKEESGEALAPPEDFPEGVALDQEIRNLPWWDAASYDSLQDWDPIVGAVLRNTVHDLDLLRESV